MCFLRIVFLCFHCMLLPTVLAVGTWEDQAFAFSHTRPQHVLKFRCNQSDSCWIMPFYGLHRQWFLGISKEQRMDSSMMFDVIIRIRCHHHQEVIARSHTESQTKLFRDPDGLRLTGVFRGAVSQEFIKPGRHVMKRM